MALAVGTSRDRPSAATISRAGAGGRLLIADLNHVCLCKARMELARVKKAARAVIAERRLARDLERNLWTAERDDLAGRDEVVDVDLVGRRWPGARKKGRRRRR